MKTQCSLGGIAQHAQQKDEAVIGLAVGELRAEKKRMASSRKRTGKNANRLLERNRSHPVATTFAALVVLVYFSRGIPIPAPGMAFKKGWSPGLVTRAEMVGIVVGK